MEYKSDINNNSQNIFQRSKSISVANMKFTNPYIYIISCFNNYLWDKELFTLKSDNDEVISIETKYKNKLFYDKNFDIIIHLIHLNSKLKILNLFLFSETNNKKLSLNEINLNSERQIVLFSDLDINKTDLEKQMKDSKEQKYVRLLSTNEKLKIYYEYFNSINQSGIQKIKNNLAMQFLSASEKDDKVVYSDIIIAFCIAFKQKIITNFLDTYTKFDIDFDKIKNKYFEQILKIYDTDKNKFYEKNKEYFQNLKKLNVYTISLENFITLYKLMNQSEKQIQKEQLKNVKGTLIKIINSKKTIIKKLYFIFSIFDKLVLVFDSDNDNQKEKLNIEIKSNEDFIEFNFEVFKAIYQELFNAQEKNDKYFLNFSDVFNNLIKIIDNCEMLIDIKKLYQKELKKFNNPYFIKNIDEQIHASGIQRISQGKFDNNFLIRLLKYDCKEKSKNYELLRYFNIELMDEEFFQYFNRERIYTLFETNFTKYLEQFAINIKEMKYFGYFFKLLPPKYFEKKSIEFLFNWFKKNVNTFDIEKCKNFKEEIIIFFKIMINNKLDNLIISLIKFLKYNLHDLYDDICISLLKEKNINLNFETTKNLMTYFFFSDFDLDNNLKFENVVIFLQSIELNKQNIKALFFIIENFSLKSDDFFDENNTRFKLFDLLINNQKINLQREIFHDSVYCQNTIYTCKSLTIKIEKLNISYKQILKCMKIIGKENMFERLKCIYKIIDEENYELKSIQIYKKICQLIDNWEIKIRKIEMMIEYNIFIANENEKINEINNKLLEYNKKLYTYKLDYLDSPESIKEYSKYIDEKSIELVVKILQLRNSNVFIRIYKQVKENETKYASERAIKEFEKLKKLFVENEQKIIKELKYNDLLKYLIEIGTKSETLLTKEIDWLINYFNIKNFSHRDFLIEKIKIYIKQQSLLQLLSGIIQFFDIFRDIFDTKNENDIDFEEKINDFITKQNSKDMITFEQFENMIKYLETQFKIDNKNEEIFNKFFNSVSKTPSPYKFIKNKKNEQIINLKEFLLEYEESGLKEADINDFILVVQFFERQTTNAKNNKFSLIYMITNIIHELSENKNIEKSFFNYLIIYNHIQILLNKYLKGTDEWMKKLKGFFDYSEFLIKLDKNKTTNKEEYNLAGTYKNNYVETNEADENNFQALFLCFFQTDLDVIFQKIFITKIPDIYKDIFNAFISLYKNIKQLLKILNNLYANGYHEIFDISIHIEESEISSKINGKLENLDSIVKNLFSINNKISEKLYIIYEEQKYLRFFYPRQLIDIYNNLFINFNNKNKEKVQSLFNIYFNNSIQKIQVVKEKDSIIIPKEGSDEYFQILESINKFISKQFELNGTTLQNIYEFNKIKIKEKPLHSKKLETFIKKKNNPYEGIFFRINTKNNQEIEALNIYTYMTQNPPNNNCFLYCSKNTCYEELKYFLLRSFLCEYYVLFCVINIDLLNYKLRKSFINLLKKYNKKYRRSMKSCLLLILNGKDEELHKIILKIKNANSLPDFVTQMKFQFDDNYKVSLVKSKFCGIGKSYKISKEKGEEIINKRTKEKIKYIYFPIGGKFDKIKFSERMDELPDMNDLSKKYVIHFDITQTKEIEFLNEFFFKLIIFRKFDINTVKHFGNNVEIIIEIPNDFIDYIKEIKIFDKLEKETIPNISQINRSDELIFVAKILTLYENSKILKNQKELNSIFSHLNLSLDECQTILLKHLKNNNLKNPNYYQINIFIKILYEEFNKFYNNEAYSSDYLELNRVPIDLRKFIITSLINITNLFILSPYENLIKNQEINQKILDEDNEKQENNINKELEIKIDSISFDNIHPSLIVFNEDGNSSTIIATCDHEDKEFIDLNKFYRIQPLEKLKNFKELSGEEIFEKLLQFLNVSGYFATNEKRNKILGTYVYTPDNFIKVILILMRIRINIPVILMGETGCGKTKLIEMASQLINRGEKKIHKLNIHAGIQDCDIIEFFKRLDIKIKNEDDRLYIEKVKEFESLPNETKNAYLKKNKLEEIYSGYLKEIENRKIWIFLDEINTCNSMGLLTEIICKHTLYGNALDSRYVFIAACNPYRVSEKGNFLLNVLYKKNQKKKNLVYTVNPLPMSLMNFVFNFGSLKPNDELAYIKSMVEKNVEKFFIGQKNDKVKKELIKAEAQCVKFVKLCQDFMKKNNDASIVSLREVNRFNIFLEFFRNYLIDRKNKKRIIEKDNEIEKIYNFYSKINEIELFYCALYLSLYICYYLRLPDKNTRQELSLLINKENKEKYFSYDFLEIPEMELNYLIKHFTVPEGIAKNKNLKENIFLLFFCIINKIPLIICGKPGRSKTLSFKILQDSMKGPLSSNHFCQQYPELLSFKIQGSLNTTSEEILKIFNKGRASQKDNNENKIYVIFMDEMGLAELSENNPLKVIHAELEQEENKIAFVGISNWFIDASKMNRVIYNVVQDPDENDLIETGKEIAKSYEIKGENGYKKFENIIRRLAKAYFNYINKKKFDKDNNQYFHGSRDFYCLIRSVMKDFINNEKKLNELELGKKNYLLNKICVKQIMRNFGGLDNSIQEFKEFFLEEYEDINYKKDLEFEYNVMQCLKDNINDENSRYLLLITESYFSQELLNYILEDICEDKNKHNEKENEIYTKYFFGSIFKSDKNNISYSNEILSKIKYQMGTNNILVLKDLESVYPALYELFNQSYTYLEGKKFVRLGESESLTLVNDNFKVIVLVDRKQIEEQEPPFLNRFEKHIINYSNLLNQDLLKISDEIYKSLEQINLCFDEFINLESNVSIFSMMDIKAKLETFVNFIKEEEIKGLVYIASIKFKNEKNNEIKYKDLITRFVFDKLVLFFSEELMILITKYGWKNKYMNYYEIIYNIYKQNYYYNLQNYMENLENDFSIVYTYSSIVEENRTFDVGIKNKKYGTIFYTRSVKEINISEINAKEQIEKEIVDFIFNNLSLEKKNEDNLLIFKFREEDLNKLNNIYYLLNDYKITLKEKNLDNKNKFVLFIIYLKKGEKIKSRNPISALSNFPQKMIDNLQNIHKNFPQILISSKEEIIKIRLLDMNYTIINNMNDIFRYFDFKIKNLNESDNSTFPWNLKILEYTIKSQNLQNIFIKCFLKFIDSEEDFIIKIFRQEICHKESLVNIDFMQLLFDYICELYFNNFRKIVIILEREQIMFSVAINDQLCQHELIQKYIDIYISQINNKENIGFKWDDKLISKKYQIQVLYGRKLPFVEKIFDHIFDYISKNISNKFLEEDTYFLYKIIAKENLHERQTKYLKNLQKLNNLLNLELNKFDIVLDILKSKDKNLIANLYKDLFFIFIKQNTKLEDYYSELSKVLDLMIQIRLKTRINDKLNMEAFNSNIDFSSFIDIIEKEIKEKIENIINDGNNNNEINIINENTYINKFLSIVIFLQSYAKDISMILEIYHFLLQYFPKIYDDIITMIKNNEIKMESSVRNEDYNQVNKACFFYIIEAICKIMNKKICILFAENNDGKEIKNQFYFQNVQYFINNLLKLEKKFMLFSSEIFLLNIIIKIIEKIIITTKNKENIDGLIVCLGEFFSKIENKSTQMKNFYIILSLIFENQPEEFSSLMSDILLNIYNIDINTREELIRDILLNSTLIHNSRLLEKSFPILNRIFQFDSIKLVDSSLKPSFFESFNEPNNVKKIIEKNMNVMNGDIIKDIFIYAFEIFFNNYFKQIKSENKDDNNEKLKIYLKEATNFYYQKSEAFNKNFELKAICKLFSIVYIKSYIKYLLDILTNKEKYQKFHQRKEILQILFNMEKNQMICVIKYYFLRLLWKKYNNWEEMMRFYNNDEELKNHFEKLIDSDENKFLFYIPSLIICNNQQENFDYDFLLFQSDINNIENKRKFHSLFLKNNNYEYLYSFLSNIMLIYYSCKDINKKNDYKNLLDSTLKYLNELDIFQDKKDIINFINLFFDMNNYEPIKEKLGFPKEENEIKIDILKEKISILYNSLRFIFSIIVYMNNNKEKEKSFYLNLLSKKLTYELDKNFIPGNFLNITLKVKTFYEVKEVITSNPKEYGAYICPCGCINSYKFSSRSYPCKSCKKNYDSLNNSSFVLIFFDAQTKAEIRNKKNINANIKDKLLYELEIDIEKEKSSLLKGLKPIDFQEFKKRNESIRDMKEITYRFLNLLLYSFIFYGDIIGNIDQRNMNKYLIENKSPFEIMEYDWVIIKEIVGKENVEIFFNLIFDTILKNILNTPDFKFKEKAVDFEKEIDGLIIHLLDNKNLIYSYKEKNERIFKLKYDSSRTIIQEIYPYDKYDKEKFPDFKYFYISELPSKKDFIMKFNSKESNKENYPVINAILNDDELKQKVRLIGYLPKINEVCNYMINFVSFRYSREEAKEKLLENEIDKNKIDLIKEFIKIYNEIRLYMRQKLGGGFAEMNLEKLKLSDLCIDPNEEGFGLYLFKIYNEMIEWQNSFINYIINSGKEKMNIYKELFNLPIMIQDCEEDQIIKLPNLDDHLKYNDNNENILDKNKFNLLRIIFDNSYKKENKILYNYKEIENTLVSNILPKLKCFKSEIRQVIYQYECFIGDRSKIIMDFIKRYPQKQFNDIESEDLIKIILEIKRTNNYDIKNILFSLHIIIDIILDQSPDINHPLYDIISEAKSNDITNMVKDFFEIIREKMKNKNIQYLNINYLFNLMELLELFLWEDIKINLEPKYKMDITDDMKNQLTNNNKMTVNDKIELCSAIRKFITRYLSAKNGENIYKINQNLKENLLNQELWHSSEEYFEDKVYRILGDLDLKVSQAFKLYEYLGGDMDKFNEILKKYDKNDSVFEEKGKDNYDFIPGLDLNLDDNKEEEKEESSENDVDENYDDYSDE